MRLTEKLKQELHHEYMNSWRDKSGWNQEADKVSEDKCKLALLLQDKILPEEFRNLSDIEVDAYLGGLERQVLYIVQEEDGSFACHFYNCNKEIFLPVLNTWRIDNIAERLNADPKLADEYRTILPFDDELHILALALREKERALCKERDAQSKAVNDVLDSCTTVAKLKKTTPAFDEFLEGYAPENKSLVSQEAIKRLDPIAEVSV